MNAIKESKQFYIDHGAKMIAEEFKEYADRIAVGLVGHGSECFGFDDDVSRDHDFGAGFCLWLTRKDEEKIGFRLTRAYDALIKEYGNSAFCHKSIGGSNSQGVQIIEDFYRQYTGRDGEPKSWQDWLYTESFFFAEATNGEVFADGLGEFSRIRNVILNGMPEDVRLKKISARALSMAQTGQYNYSRCLAHGEGGAAVLALSEFVKNACEMIFLLNRRHCPYYKWVFKAMRGLDKLSDMSAPLEYLLTADNDKQGQTVKKEIVEDICLAVANELKAQDLAECQENYLEPYAYAVRKKIKNSEIRDLHILIG